MEFEPLLEIDAMMYEEAMTKINLLEEKFKSFKRRRTSGNIREEEPSTMVLNPI